MKTWAGAPLQRLREAWARQAQQAQRRLVWTISLRSGPEQFLCLSGTWLWGNQVREIVTLSVTARQGHGRWWWTGNVGW